MEIDFVDVCAAHDSSSAHQMAENVEDLNKTRLPFCYSISDSHLITAWIRISDKIGSGGRLVPNAKSRAIIGAIEQTKVTSIPLGYVANIARVPLIGLTVHEVPDLLPAGAIGVPIGCRFIRMLQPEEMADFMLYDRAKILGSFIIWIAPLSWWT